MPETISEELPPEVEKKYLAEKLRQIKQDWTDDEPDVISEGKGKKKRRRTWPTIAVGFMDYCKDSGFLSHDLSLKVSDISNNYSGVEYRDRPTTEEDIQIIDNLIDEVVAELEKIINNNPIF